MDSEGMTRLSDTAALLTALVIPCTGAFMTFTLILDELKSGWFNTLVRHPFDPSPMVHMTMWACLYVFKGFATYFLWKEAGGFTESAKLPLTAYAVNLVMLWLFVPIFFESHNLRMAYYIIVLGNVTLLVEIALFCQVSLIGATLLLPCLVWLSFSCYTFRYLTQSNPQPSVCRGVKKKCGTVEHKD